LFLAATKTNDFRYRAAFIVGVAKTGKSRTVRSARFSHDRFVLSSLPVSLSPETFPRFMLAKPPASSRTRGAANSFAALLAVPCYIALAIQRKTPQHASIIAATAPKSAIVWERYNVR